MQILFTDLDNTLMYSHRHIFNGEKVWVERLNNRQQSYMTKNTYEYLRSQNWIRVVPVTTRTLKQYSRLFDVAKDLHWDDALICNGALRLVNGVEDKQWTEESLTISETDLPYLHAALKEAYKKFEKSAIAEVSSLMFYIKTDDVESAYEFIKQNSDMRYLQIYRDARKVYCIPNSLSKGMALQRFLRKSGDEFCIAAGDSEFDISMLKKADIAFCPENLMNYIFSKKKIVACQGVFSDSICDEMERIRRKVSGND